MIGAKEEKNSFQPVHDIFFVSNLHIVIGIYLQFKHDEFLVENSIKSTENENDINKNIFGKSSHLSRLENEKRLFKSQMENNSRSPYGRMYKH